MGDQNKSIKRYRRAVHKFTWAKQEEAANKKRKRKMKTAKGSKQTCTLYK